MIKIWNISAFEPGIGLKLISNREEYELMSYIKNTLESKGYVCSVDVKRK